MSRVFTERRCLFYDRCDDYHLQSQVCNKWTDDKRFFQCSEFQEWSYYYLRRQKEMKKYGKGEEPEEEA
jgi:hypothetical protein